MSRKLFVGNLPWETDSDRLEEAFASYGEVTEAKVVTDRDTGKSRGFGFVTFMLDADAEEAMTKLDGSELSGRQLSVQAATEQRGRGGGGK